MLTDLATVKRSLSLFTTNSDQKLSLLIPDQTQQFLDETGRTTGFDLQTYTETRDGLGNDTMQLMNWPVQSITSLTKNGILVPPSTGWNVRGYQFDVLGKLTLICDTFSCNPGITFDRKNVIAVYIAGYPTITVANELQTIPATTPATPQNPAWSWPPAYTIFVQQPNWQSDVKVVFFVGGSQLTAVLGPPAAGQYFLLGNGGYLFNSADAGKQVLMTYVAAGYPADLVGAVTRMVALRYYQQGHEDKKQEKQGDGTTTFSKEAYPSDVLRVIKKYKKQFFLPGF
jgi:hypothetical protein